MKTNLQILQESLERARRERFLIYDNPTVIGEKIIIEAETNVVNIVKIKNNKVDSCSCSGEKPCKHMIKIADKMNLDVNLGGIKKVVKKKTTSTSEIKLKAVK